MYQAVLASKWPLKFKDLLSLKFCQRFGGDFAQTACHTEIMGTNPSGSKKNQRFFFSTFFFFFEFMDTYICCCSYFYSVSKFKPLYILYKSYLLFTLSPESLATLLAASLQPSFWLLKSFSIGRYTTRNLCAVFIQVAFTEFIFCNMYRWHFNQIQTIISEINALFFPF